MNPESKSHWLVTLGLAIGLLLVGFAVYMQATAIKDQGRKLDTVINALSQDKVMEKEPDAMMKSDEQGLEMLDVPTPGVNRPRTAFDSPVSPDRAWEAVILDDAIPGEALRVTHRLVLRSRTGGAERELVRVTEERQASYEEVAGKPYTSYWKIAGWSADGASVYYVRQPITEGLGGFYPQFSSSVRELYEVVVATGQVERVFAYDQGGPINGIRDVLANKNLMVSSVPVDGGDRSEVVITDLNGQNPKTRYRTQEVGEGIAAAVFNPSGTKLMIVTFQDVSEGEEYAYRYKLVSYDIARQWPTDVRLSDYAVSGAYPRYFEDPQWINDTAFFFAAGETAGSGRTVTVE